MSRGSRIVKVRVPENLLAWIEETIAGRNQRTRKEPWTMSDFLREAVAEKLKHMSRSRRRVRKPQSFRCTSCGAETTTRYYHEKDESTVSLDTLCGTCAKAKDGDLSPP